MILIQCCYLVSKIINQTCKGAPYMLMHLCSHPWKAPQTCVPSDLFPPTNPTNLNVGCIPICFGGDAENFKKLELSTELNLFTILGVFPAWV